MARRRSLEDTLAALNRLRDDPTAEGTTRELRRVLGSKNSFAVARAAQIAGELEIRELAPDLVAAFERFLVDPAKSDRNCGAKTAIAEALDGLGYEGAELFLRGIRHVQMEPVYGGSVDTAAGLRGACALGLVRMQYHDVLTELADLLADPEPPARLAAAVALGYTGAEGAAALLRFKALTGDEDPGVTSECLNGLLRMTSGAAIDFVARFLDRRDEVTREVAALALGGSRLAEAFEILASWWKRTHGAELRKTGLLAIGMLAQEEAFEFLLSLIAGADARTAGEAVAALEVYLEDETMLERVRQAVGKRAPRDLEPSILHRLGLLS